jgi:hypothetical protein
MAGTKYVYRRMPSNMAIIRPNISRYFYLFFRYYYEKCPEIVSEQKTVYVEIALYLMNLHSVDLKAGTFHADFYLYFKGKSAVNTDPFN